MMGFNKENIHAVILTGTRDFGRYPLASRLPAAVWPIAGRPAIEHLLRHLSRQGIRHATICSNGDGPLLKESITATGSIKLKFMDEPLPVGTAGCIRDAAEGDKNELFLVFPAAMTSPPNVDLLIQAHENGKSELTVVLEPAPENGGTGCNSAGIYICRASVLEYIPKEGYCDIKEALIPALLLAGKTIHTTTLKQPTGSFRNRVEYLSAIASYLQSGSDSDIDLPCKAFNRQEKIWLARSAKVDPSAQIHGPVVIMAEAVVSKEALIFGPTIIGRGANIGNNSLIVNSVLWDGAHVGENCRVQRCVVDYQAVVRNHTVVQEKAIPFKPEGMLKSPISAALEVINCKADRMRQALQTQFDKVNEKLPRWAKSPKINIFSWLAAGLVVLAFIWSYRPNIVGLWVMLLHSDEYSSGLLVPLIAVYVLWARRQMLAGCPLKPCMWGILALIAAQMVRLFGLFFMYGSAERLSIVLTVAALVLFLFGWQLFRRVWTILLFLLLMLPWPNRIQTAVTLPLQSWATSSAVFCLELFGFEVVRQGNIIEIGNTSVAVAEACNGLRMVMAFFVITGLVVLLVKRTWWEKIIVFASSLPVALLCNTARLTITAIAFTVINGEKWEKVFHDFGGYAMMPLALAIIVGELWLLTRLTVMPNKQQSIVITRNKI